MVGRVVVSQFLKELGGEGVADSNREKRSCNILRQFRHGLIPVVSNSIAPIVN